MERFLLQTLFYSLLRGRQNDWSGPLRAGAPCPAPMSAPMPILAVVAAPTSAEVRDGRVRHGAA